MAKTKAPFLSLASSGTIGNSITTQQRHGQTIVRTKPIPTYTHTLPQQYQRWLYEDYCSFWKIQTEATKRIYAAAGSKHHLTAFQEWMKYCLTSLPDIAAWWKLDEQIAAVTADSSRNDNDATIFGATPADGIINRCLSFDGLNDYVNCGHGASLDVTSELTLYAWVKVTGAGIGPYPPIISKGYDTSYEMVFAPATPIAYFIVTTPAGNITGDFGVPFSLNTWYFLVGTYHNVTGLKTYRDAQPITSLPANGNIKTTSRNVYLGSYDGSAQYLKALIDDPHILTRVLAQSDIQRLMQRRHP